MIKAAYRLGFPFVSRATRLPDHSDFHASANRKKMRIILAATRVPLESPFFSAVEEPREYFDPWLTPLAKIRQLLRLSRGFIQMPMTEKIRVLRKKWEMG
ncbi:MAG TPA: hypothetical protein VGT03_06215 [Candidatus Acidoferrales bacterium]|nr:hypothetical protein [Candidatus Acidoferrales bacterium]